MDGAIVSAMRGFDLKCRSTVREKAGFVCATDKGIKKIKKVNTSTGDIWFQHQIKELLFQNGFVNTDRYCMSAQNTPYYETGGETYVVTEHLPFSESNFSDGELFRCIVEAVARMHVSLKDSSIKAVSYENMQTKGIQKKGGAAAKQAAELAGYRKRIMKQGKFSDFDILFLKGYDFYASSINEWNEITNGENANFLCKQAEARNYICHNLLKEENILHHNGDIYITNFSEASAGHYLYDLAYIVKRYLKSSPVEMIPLEEIIFIYDSYNRLNKQELQFLYGLLIFPDKFIKICESYYTKKRTWTPVAYLSRMEDMIGTKEAHRNYIREFYH